MTTFQTLNPLGSKDPRDLYDNAENYDAAMNDRANQQWIDRFGVGRPTWFGVEQRVNEFLAASGFESTPLEYVDGSPLTVDRPTQLIQRDGNLYSVKLPASFPIELSGNWSTDQNLLVAQVDRSLRQQLADPLDPSAGAALVARASRHLSDLTGLIGLIGRYAGDMVQTAAYWGGWSVYADGPVGGGTYVWDPARPRSEHNAGNVISPTMPWDGLESSFAAYIAKTGETEPSALGCWVLVPENGREFNVLQWGAKNDASTGGANDAMIQPLLDYVESVVGGGFGGIVNFPRGNYRFMTYFSVRDRTTLRGEGTSASIIQFYGTGTGNCITLGPVGPRHPINPPGHWVFGTRLENLAISGANIYRGLERSMVYTDGAHEHSGLFNVVVRDFVSWGVNYNTGNGGPAFFNFSDVEMYGSNTAPTTGSKRGLVCQAGGALILVDRSTITGGETNKLDHAILMLKDNLIANGVHIEQATVGISLGQSDSTAPKVNVLSGITGNPTVPDLCVVSSTFEGSVNASGLVNTSLSVTGLGTLKNNRTGEVYLDRSISSYKYGLNVGQGVAVSHGRISIAAGTASIVKSTGRTFTAQRTATGVVRITLSLAMPDTNYVVSPMARSTTGMIVEFAPVSATTFDIKTFDAAGTATDPSSIWFALFS
ncbi:hypothetical protein [Pseudomonas aeruginosa]|uniref:hypothetical protein n=1 Tax=Pseudomonas aeruginosa TaxID=287 RepID=UPI001CD2A07A|nr:hypothetical protein [Pseudomonas aeruginosa]